MAQPENKAPEWKIVHPSLDFVDEQAYIGIRKLTRNGVRTYLLRDDRTLIECTAYNLINSDISLQPQRCFHYPKWSDQSITAFTNGTARADETIKLYQDVEDLFTTYMDYTNKRVYSLLSLWNIGTYYHPLFSSYPYIYMNGPTESGKSKTLELSSCISFNGQFSLHMNPAGIFRMVNESRCTLFIDEIENLIGRMKNHLFRTMLLGGYKKGSIVQRMVYNEQMDDYEPRDYATYSPKMLANIAGMDEVLQSRCITIHTQHSLNSKITRRAVEFENPNFQQIRDRLFVYMMNNWKAIRQAYNETQEVEDIEGRDWEIWKPILGLANHFGGNDLVDEMKTLALECADENQLNIADSNESLLVESLLSLVTKDAYYSLSAIKEEFVKHLEDGNWVRERYVGRLLRSLGFHNRRRMNFGYEYLIETSRLRQLAQAYAISVPNGVESVASVDDEGTLKEIPREHLVAKLAEEIEETDL